MSSSAISMDDGVEASGADAGSEAPSRLKIRLEDPRRVWNLGMVIALTCMFSVAGYERRWLADDGLIYTRTVRQILAGNGPVFNVGERAESSTGTIWQWVLALLAWVTGANPAKIAVYLGLFLAGVGFLIALHAGQRLVLGHTGSVFLIPAGALVLLALPPVWDFETSGLETGLATFWMASAWWLLVHARTEPRFRTIAATAFVFGLGPLVRPDLALVTLCFMPAYWLAVRPSRMRTLGLIAIAGALPLAYEIFRAGFYGELVPLPAVVKEASESAWGRGFTYLWNFIGPYDLWLPLATVLGVGVYAFTRLPKDRKTLPIVLAPVLAGVLMAGYVVRLGGDFMHARMLLPALFMLMLPAFVLPVRRIHVSVCATALAVWAVLCASTLRVGLAGVPNILDERAYWTNTLSAPNLTNQSAFVQNFPIFPGALDAATAGKTHVLVSGPDQNLYTLPLADSVDADLVVFFGTLGTNGAITALNDIAVDPDGLAYPLAAHVELESRGRAGHEKSLGDVWIVAQYTAPGTVLPPFLDPKAVAAARHALTCGPMKDLMESAYAPMSWSRFWDNLTGAASRTSFRFPEDPFAAEKEFCGGN